MSGESNATITPFWSLRDKKLIQNFKIEISLKRCPDSSDCGQCLRSCPTGVFIQYPRSPSKNKGLSPDSKPQARRPVAVYPELCTGCWECVNSCPQDAITVRAKH
ncbi:MAG: 4Fe-4S dicluster domain-containing protein [Candidatus Hodarchaeales archaeon]